MNKSLCDGNFSEFLKVVKVIPIYKAKDKILLNNHRSISLLPAISKILENITHKGLYNFVLTQEVIYKCQYGFRKP